MIRLLQQMGLAVILMVWGGAAGAEGMDGADRYTLFDLYRVALERSEEIRISGEDVFSSEKNREMALSVLFPRFSGVGNIRRYDNKLIQGDALIQPQWSGYWGARLDQSFTLNGKEFIALHMADDQIEKARHDLHATKEAYLFSLTEAFFGAARAMKAVEIAKASVARLELHKKSVESRLQVEAVTQTALFRAEAELSSARAEQVRSEHAYASFLEVLSRLSGVVAIGGIVSPANPQKVSLPEPLEALQRQALQNRAEILSAEAVSRLSQKQVRYAQSAWWPTVTLESAYLQYEQGPSDRMAPDDSFWVAAGLTLPIFDAGLRRAQIAEARSRSRQAALMRQLVEKEILLEMDTAYRQFMKQQGLLSSLEDQARFARENHTAVTRQFDNGLADTVAVMDANTLMVTSEQELADAFLGLQLALLRIDRARGAFLSGIENRLRKSP